MATLTGFTFSGTGGFVTDASTTRTIQAGSTAGSTTTGLYIVITTGASVVTVTTGSWFNNLDFGTTTFNPAQHH
jgi:hypothetical protein